MAAPDSLSFVLDIPPSNSDRTAINQQLNCSNLFALGNCCQHFEIVIASRLRKREIVVDLCVVKYDVINRYFTEYLHDEEQKLENEKKTSLNAP